MLLLLLSLTKYINAIMNLKQLAIVLIFVYKLTG